MNLKDKVLGIFRSDDGTYGYQLEEGYKEILLLGQLLSRDGIPHTLKRFLDGWQIIYPSEEDRVVSVIEHFGSYGKDMDLLEIMGLLTPEEREHDTVVGHLSAAEVHARILNHWRNEVQK